MSEFCVIGSGISGATIANLLNKKFQVNLYDKGRGPGGRASFKRVKGQIGFDHGTQYFSPKTIEFKKFVNRLIKIKILKKLSEELKLCVGLCHVMSDFKKLITCSSLIPEK